MSQPNLLFIMTDQQRLDSLGCFSEWMKTPALDEIARQGTVFRNCITNSPVCIPARLSLATGYYPHQLGVVDNVNIDLLPSQSLWTQQIKQAGYQTAVFGKTHLHHHAGDLRDREHLVKGYGFDVVDEIGGPRASAYVGSNMTDLWEQQGWLQQYRADYRDRFENKPYVARPSVLPFELYADNYVGEKANQYLQSVDTSAPWFCWVSFGGPHEPWDTPEPYASMYDVQAIPPAIPSQITLLDNNKNGVTLSKLKQALKLKRQDVQALRANYAGNVSLIDRQIGRLLKTLKRNDQLDNTIIILTSDHGEMNGDHGLIYKNVFFDQAVRVPLIVSTPKQRSSSSQYECYSDAQIELFDIGPTVMDLLSLPVSDKQQAARSFARCIYQVDASHREWLFSEVSGEVMIMNQQYKMAVNQQQQPYLLFDYRKQTQETVNHTRRISAMPIKHKLLKKIKQHLATKLV